MKVRILSGIVLIIVTVLPLYFGGPVLLGVSIILSLGGMYELYKLENIHKSILACLGYVLSVCYYMAIYFDRVNLLMPILVLAFMADMFLYVISYPKYKASQVIMAFFGMFYLTVMLSYIYRVRVLQNGIYLVWLIYITSWVNDTFAYFTGMAFGRGGKHKMAPMLSPKKTLEGLFGGIIITGLVGAGYGAYVGRYIKEIQASAVFFAIVSLGGAAISVIGDLAASALKRNYGIKDYGKLIPGHGGILDRYDSVIFTAPVVYYLVELLNNYIKL